MMLMLLFRFFGQVYTQLCESPVGIYKFHNRSACYHCQAAGKQQAASPPNAGGEAFVRLSPSRLANNLRRRSAHTAD